MCCGLPVSLLAYRLIILRLERNKSGEKTRITVLPLSVRRKYQRRCCLLRALV